MQLPETASLTDSSASASNNNENWSSKLAREAYVIGGGIFGGAADGVIAIADNPKQLAFDVAGSVGLVLAMRGPAPLRAVAGAAAMVGQIMFAKETLSGVINAAPIVADTWNSAKQTAVNKALIGRELGPVLVDSAVMGVAGVATAKLIEAPSVWRAWSKSDLVPRLTMENGLPIHRIGYRQAKNYYAAADSIVRIGAVDANNGWSEGTGFVVSDDGLVVTAKHVLTKGLNRQTMKVTAHLNGRGFEAKVIGEDPLNDLSILQLTKNHPDETFQPLNIASRPADPESETTTIGFFPNQKKPVASPGRLLQNIQAGKDRYFDEDVSEGFTAGAIKHKTTALGLNGMSGGPVFNRSGEVIGVNTHRNASPGGVFSLATPVQPLSDLVQAARLLPREIKVRSPHYSPSTLGSFIDNKDGVREKMIAASKLLNHAVVESLITPDVGDLFRQRYFHADGHDEIDRVTAELARIGVAPDAGKRLTLP